MHDPKQRESYGKGSVDIDVPEADLDLSRTLAKRLQQRFAEPSYQPPALPSVATKLLELSRESDVEFRRVCEVLEQDQMLTGKVLARAQSAAYAGAAPTRTLHDALVRLGLATIRNLVLEMAFNMTVFRAATYGKPMEALRRHSLTVAYGARLVARQTAVDAEYAFLCGLLHDVGVNAALILLGSEPGTARPSIEQVWASLPWIHEDLSGQIVKLWKLPPEVQMVVGQHHRMHIGGQAHPAIAALRVAEGMAEALGLGLTSPDLAAGYPFETTSPEEQAQAAAVLKLSPATRERVFRQLEELKPQILE
jgi:HD-like signal output (HDOD) protein